MNKVFDKAIIEAISKLLLRISKYFRHFDSLRKLDKAKIPSVFIKVKRRKLNKCTLHIKSIKKTV